MQFPIKPDIKLIFPDGNEIETYKIILYLSFPTFTDAFNCSPDDDSINISHLVDYDTVKNIINEQYSKLGIGLTPMNRKSTKINKLSASEYLGLNKPKISDLKNVSLKTTNDVEIYLRMMERFKGKKYFDTIISSLYSSHIENIKNADIPKDIINGCIARLHDGNLTLRAENRKFTAKIYNVDSYPFPLADLRDEDVIVPNKNIIVRGSKTFELINNNKIFVTDERGPRFTFAHPGENIKYFAISMCGSHIAVSLKRYTNIYHVSYGNIIKTIRHECIEYLEYSKEYLMIGVEHNIKIFLISDNYVEFQGITDIPVKTMPIISNSRETVIIGNCVLRGNPCRVVCCTISLSEFIKITFGATDDYIYGVSSNKIARIDLIAKTGGSITDNPLNKDDKISVFEFNIIYDIKNKYSQLYNMLINKQCSLQ